MWAFIVKRLIHAVFVMWLVATVIFIGMRNIPGGPEYAMLGPDATQAQLEAVREQLGLDQPLYIQYYEWVAGLLQFDMGTSIRTGQQITEMIANALPITFAIGSVGVIIGLLIAIPTGIISATQKGKVPDQIATIFAFMGLSAPSFFIGILLIVLFGVHFSILPVYGYTPLSEGVIPWFRSILLPGLAVGLPYSAVIMRMMRSSLLEVLDAPFMKTARAKGIDKNVRLYKHALQNALIPVVTIAGIQLAVVIGGSVTVEIVFGIRGMGQVIVDAVINRDYPVAESAILVLAFGFVIINLIVDITYTFIDPRIRYDGES